MAKNEIPKISDFQSLGLCDGFAKVYCLFVIKDPFRIFGDNLYDSQKKLCQLLSLTIERESWKWRPNIIKHCLQVWSDMDCGCYHRMAAACAVLTALTI